MTLKLSPTHRAVLEAVCSHGTWLSTYDLGRMLPQYTGETVNKKARDLRRHGYINVRKVPDHKTGGIFVEYHYTTRAVELSRVESFSPAPAGGALFDWPQDKTVLGRTKL